MPTQFKDDSQKIAFTQVMMKTFYAQDWPSSQDFLTTFKKELTYSQTDFSTIAENLKIDEKDFKYGIITLNLESSPSNIQFRLKKENAYGGPKTEHYIERISLRIEAAKKYVENQPLSEDEKNKKFKALDAILNHVTKELIKPENLLNPEILGNLNRHQPGVVEHFETQHTKAKSIMAGFIDLVSLELGASPEEKQSKTLQQSLYNIEAELMSSKRPELINIRFIPVGNKNYTEINIASPVDTERTLSSAKKDEVGVANWLANRTLIYKETSPDSIEFSNLNYREKNYEKVDDKSQYRLASIVPQAIITGSKIKNKLNRRLAKETARRNVREHILPELLEKMLENQEAKTSQQQNNENAQPLHLNMEMLSLISPIHKWVDRFQDPDASQFIDIRDALNFYNNRELNIDGNNVLLDAIYHNYGANKGRGFPIQHPTNAKGFNDIIERSTTQLMLVAFSGDTTINQLLENIPGLNSNQLIKINSAMRSLEENYQQLDTILDEFSSQEHARLMQLNSALLKNELPGSQKEEYEKLKQKFSDTYAKTSSLRKEVKQQHNIIYRQHVALQKTRKSYIRKHAKKFQGIIKQLENAKTNPTEVKHLRTLFEFMNGKAFGHTDSMLNRFRGKNTYNYQLQTYIQLLNSFTGYAFYKGCKSAKDRTAAQEETAKAKNLMSLHFGTLPEFYEVDKPDSSLSKLERLTAERGILQGPNSDIVTYNMPPGMLMIDEGDLETDISLKMIKTMATLQKGINHLKGIDEEVKAKIITEYQAQNANLSPTQSKKSLTSPSSQTTSRKSSFQSKSVVEPSPTLLFNIRARGSSQSVEQEEIFSIQQNSTPIKNEDNKDNTTKVAGTKSNPKDSKTQNVTDNDQATNSPRISDKANHEQRADNKASTPKSVNTQTPLNTLDILHKHLKQNKEHYAIHSLDKKSDSELNVRLRDPVDAKKECKLFVKAESDGLSFNSLKNIDDKEFKHTLSKMCDIVINMPLSSDSAIRITHRDPIKADLIYKTLQQTIEAAKANGKFNAQKPPPALILASATARARPGL